MKKSDLLIYSWNDVASISRNLALTIFKNEKIDLVVGITSNAVNLRQYCGFVRGNEIDLSLRREREVKVELFT